jgi:hypothetical protein
MVYTIIVLYYILSSIYISMKMREFRTEEEGRKLNTESSKKLRAEAHITQNTPTDHTPKQSRRQQHF